jgi:transposase, IS6 family
MYLYRAVASRGKTLEFQLSPTRDAQAARHFFEKALSAGHVVAPRVITVDKNAAYPKAFRELKATGALAASCEFRQSKYLNHLIKQDHRFIKRLVKPGMGFWSFETAWRTLQGYEVVNMMRKGQIQGVRKGDSVQQAAFIAELFGVAISTQQQSDEVPFLVFLFVFLQHSRKCNIKDAGGPSIRGKMRNNVSAL